MKIVHISDLHIGYKAYNKLEKNGLNVREIDILSAFQENVRSCQIPFVPGLSGCCHKNENILGCQGL